MKLLLKYSYHLIYFLFLVGLVLVVFVRQHISNELFAMIINYYFWYIFGIVSGIFLNRIINKYYGRIIEHK